MRNNSAFAFAKIALRNLARHKVKTGLTCAAITISVAVFIFMKSWIGAMAIESRRNIVNYDMSAAKLQTQLYFERRDERPSFENFANWRRFSDALAAEGFNSAPRFVFGGTLFSNSGSAPMVFNAVDFEAESRVLHYLDHIEFGRLPESGRFEMLVGIMAAQKLRVGIPTRPRRLELEELIAQTAQTEEDAAFIRSLYTEPPVLTGLAAMYAAEERVVEGNERLILRRDAEGEEVQKLWDLIAATDRNNVRISAVIDVRALPDIIREGAWDGELMPELRQEDKELVKNAYSFEPFLGGYLLTEEDEEVKGKVLDAMIRAGFRGAVRHVNQLVNAVVVGVINSPDPVPNGNTAYMPKDALQDDAGMRLEGSVTELLIRKKGVHYSQLPTRHENAEAITAAIERGLGEALPDYLGVFFWMDYMEDYFKFEAMESGATQALSGILILLSLLVISNTILLAVLERTKEIGMMRAMGMTDGQMILTYMFESAFIGMIGAIFGIILGCLINWPMVEYGWDLSSMADELSGNLGFRVTAVMRSGWDIPLIIITGIVATFVSALTAYIPTKRAVKMAITDSLRFE